MQMTPYKIEILLHYYSSDLQFHGSDCIAYREAITEFANAGIVELKCGTVVPNAAAIECYVNALLTVPLPRMTWNVEMPK